MKKTIYTVMTAAMFAAANLSAGSAVAADNDGNGRVKVDPVENVSLSDKNWNGSEDESELSKVTTTAMNNLTNLTNTTTQTLYGPPWMFTSTTTTIPVLLYGPPLTTSTLEEDIDEEISKFKGDVNGDEIIDTFDAIALRRAILFDEYKDERAKLLSDINSDGKVDVSDLVLLQRFLLGAIKDFSGYDNGHTHSLRTTTKKDDKEKETTFTTTYDPRGDVVISLYGIKPSIEIMKESVNQALQDIEDAGAILDELEHEEDE